MLYILAIATNLFWLAAHPFHVSVCDINFNAETSAVEITHKIFLDDLENALRNEAGRSVDLVKNIGTDEFEALLVKYLQSNFSCAVDGKKTTLTYVGSEIQADALWVYQEAVNVDTFTRVEVKNTILFELFDDQTNLVHVKKNKKTKSFRLYDDIKRGEVEF